MSHQKILRSFKIRDLEAYNKFMELVTKEGISCSEKLEEFITQYVKEHYPGNPQRDLRKYFATPPPRVICPDGEKGWCPNSIKLCAMRRRYACKFDR